MPKALILVNLHDEILQMPITKLHHFKGTESDQRRLMDMMWRKTTPRRKLKCARDEIRRYRTLVLDRGEKGYCLAQAALERMEAPRRAGMKKLLKLLFEDASSTTLLSAAIMEHILLLYQR